MIGGCAKNFAQDIVVVADILGLKPQCKYAIQITVADVRDGALSSSTLKEASSWGKVDTTFEQMVYSEATWPCRSLQPCPSQESLRRGDVGGRAYWSRLQPDFRH